MLTGLVTPGAADEDPSAVLSAEERSVVVFRASRQHARMFGSVMGPTVLAPGPSEGWQVLAVLPGTVSGDVLAQTIRFAGGPFEREEPPALSLHRKGSTWWFTLPVARLTGRSWAWGDHALSVVAFDQVLGLLEGDAPVDHWPEEEMIQHLAVIVPEVSPDDLVAVLHDKRGDGRPLHDLVALLGLPTAAMDMLEVEESELPDQGQVLLRSEKKRYARDVAEIELAERGQAPIAREMWTRSVAADRVGDKTFGVVFIAIGVVTVALGALYLLLDLPPTRSLAGLDHPAAWVVLGVALVWYGRYLRRRGSRRPSELHED